MHSRDFSKMTIHANIYMTVASTRFIAAVALAIAAAGCGSEPEPPAPIEPACAPRSASDPARLTIAGSAKGFGVAPPCEATLEFSIARNTELRALDATVRLRDGDGKEVAKAPMTLALDGPRGGMFRGSHALAPLAGQSCRQTSIALEIERCADADDRAIPCPDVRVRPSQVLLRLEASGDGVPVCYDD